MRSIPCLRNQFRSSGPSGRARAASVGFSIQEKPCGWAMAGLDCRWPAGARQSQSRRAQRVLTEARTEKVGLLPHFRLSAEEVDQIACRDAKRSGSRADAGTGRLKDVE